MCGAVEQSIPSTYRPAPLAQTLVLTCGRHRIRRPSSMPRDHILVVGAGIIGASIAYHLAKRGARVTIAEAQRPAAGATGKSFGWINATFSKRPRAYYEFNLLGMAEWRRLETELDGEL